MLFRGFLYPVLDRWLQTLFMTPRQLRRGCIWILIMAAWGYVEHRLPLAWSVLLAVVVFLVVGALVVARSLRSGERPSGLCAAAGLPRLWPGDWRRERFPVMLFGIATTVLLVLAVSARSVQHGAGTGNLGRPAGGAGSWRCWRPVIAFAMVHSEQLGQAWGPLLVLFVVGLVLTITRVVTRSVTPGLLIHVGYNLMLFGVLYIGTDHFRHLERMTQ